DLVSSQRHKGAAVVQAGELIGLRKHLKLTDTAMARNRITDRANHIVRVGGPLDKAVFGARQENVDARNACRLPSKRNNGNIRSVTYAANGFDSFGVRQKKVEQQRIEQ